MLRIVNHLLSLAYLAVFLSVPPKFLVVLIPPVPSFPY
jgi:hypothetical protein